MKSKGIIVSVFLIAIFLIITMGVIFVQRSMTLKELKQASAQTEQEVQIKDEIAPVIELKGNKSVTINKGETYKEEGYSATDNLEGNIESKVKTEKEVIDDNNYKIIYTVSDEEGNTATAERKITIKEKVEVAKTTNTNTNSSSKNTSTKTSSSSKNTSTKTSSSSKNTSTKTSSSSKNTSTKTSSSSKNTSTSTSSSNKNTSTSTTSSSKNTSTSTSSSSKNTSTSTTSNSKNTSTSTSSSSKNTSTNTTSSSTSTSSSSKNTSSTSSSTTSTSKGVIYLTFDDGPTTSSTPKILDILKKYNVKATFFLLNYNSTTEPLVKREVAEGHSVGIHGYSHTYKEIYKSVDTYMENLTKLQSKIYKSTGVKTTITRFPGGSSNTVSKFNPGIMTKLSKEVVNRGFQYYDWNVSSEDAGGAKSSSEVYKNVTKHLSKKGRNFVLMHDFANNTKTINALEDIIKYAQKNGFVFEKITSSTPMIKHKINN